jgi:NAD(P)-dependent dehydrogenase (short-subunit alcohol dehydrogenase family)
MTELGKRTTAEAALRGKTLEGINAIVTGASSGLGIETARVLAGAGANVFMACRSVEAGKQAAATFGSTKVQVEPLDLMDLGSVKSFADRWGSKPLHLLINNAGIMATPLGYTAQGLEQQLGTNHLGHFVLTRALLGSLAPHARVVNLSSALHSRGRADRLLATMETDPKYEQRKYVPFDAYGDSKLANILLTRALAKRLPSSVSTFAVHPGVIATGLTRSMLQNIPGGTAIYRAIGRLFLKSIPQGAATTIFAATAPELEGKTALYLADCAEAPSTRESTDDDLAERLWTSSEKRASD